jgi:HAD superfamily hydrolase (TIGR01509 family)
MTAVTFDYGQTLAELDTDFLAKRVAERGGSASRAALDAASPVAWEAYNEAKRQGKGGYDAWSTFMFTLLAAGAKEPAAPAARHALVDFLWSEQPRRNLWRRPIVGMKELVDDLLAKGTKIAIISNSEGRLSELVAEMGLGTAFRIVADSGVLGVEKPDPRIFEWTASELGVDVRDFVHIGDAWEADVEGALKVGARAIWVTPDATVHSLPAAVTACRDATEIRAALGRLHVL